MVDTPSTYVIQGREITLPLHIGQATGGVAVFSASAERVAERLPAGLAPVRLPNGRAMVVLMLVDYIDNPLGDYDEGVVGFAVRPEEKVGAFGMWVEHMPVSQAFTREAGETIWGYPKTLDDLAIVRDAKRAVFTWDRGGERIMRLEVTTGGVLRTPAIRGATYTCKDGVVHRTVMTARASGVRVRPRGARVELGDHPVGRALAELELSERAMLSVWLERVSMDFGPAMPLHGLVASSSTR